MMAAFCPGGLLSEWFFCQGLAFLVVFCPVVFCPYNLCLCFNSPELFVFCNVCLFTAVVDFVTFDGSLLSVSHDQPLCLAVLLSFSVCVLLFLRDLFSLFFIRPIFYLYCLKRIVFYGYCLCCCTISADKDSYRVRVWVRTVNCHPSCCEK